MLIQHLLHRRPDGLRSDPPPAAQAQPQDRGHQQQRLPEGGLPPPGDADAHRPAVPPDHAGGQLPLHGEVAAQGHRALQNGGGHRFCGLHAVQKQPLPGGPGVHGKPPVYVGGGGDHGHGPQLLRQPEGQGVGPADVPGQQGDDEPAQLVHAQHRRVGALVPHPGGDGAHGDARRPHEHQGVRPGEQRPGGPGAGGGQGGKVPAGQLLRGEAAAFVPRPEQAVPGQQGGVPPPAGVGKQGQLHGFHSLPFR